MSEYSAPILSPGNKSVSLFGWVCILVFAVMALFLASRQDYGVAGVLTSGVLAGSFLVFFSRAGSHELDRHSIRTRRGRCREIRWDDLAEAQFPMAGLGASGWKLKAQDGATIHVDVNFDAPASSDFFQALRAAAEPLVEEQAQRNLQAGEVRLAPIRGMGSGELIITPLEIRLPGSAARSLDPRQITAWRLVPEYQNGMLAAEGLEFLLQNEETASLQACLEDHAALRAYLRAVAPQAERRDETWAQEAAHPAGSETASDLAVAGKNLKTELQNAAIGGGCLLVLLLMESYRGFTSNASAMTPASDLRLGMLSGVGAVVLAFMLIRVRRRYRALQAVRQRSLVR